MAIFPVDILESNELRIGGNPLVNSDGNLIYNGKILAKYEELMKMSIVSNFTERDLLEPKKGDICKVTSNGTSYIFNDNWIPIGRSKVTVSTLSEESELELLEPFIGDISNVTSSGDIFMFDGDEWKKIFSIENIIDDESVNTKSTWSSSKVDYLIKNHNHDGGTY